MFETTVITRPLTTTGTVASTPEGSGQLGPVRPGRGAQQPGLDDSAQRAHGLHAALVRAKLTLARTLSPPSVTRR
ncbi:MAG TPA: hypothetical protein VFP34_19055 [Microlunatus sp.]|nr:hypothetical protein [Microlunatus sp.]